MKKAYCILWGLAFTILGMISTPATAQTSQFWVYIGTNNHPPSKSKGIYLYRFDASTGAITDRSLAAQIDDPGWQDIPPGGKFLYTCATIDDHQTSIVAGYSIDPATGALTQINQQVSKGEDTTHVDVDPNRTCLVSANYGSGDISVFTIEPDGSLTPPTAVIKHTGSSVNSDRQRHAYPHSCNFDPTGKWVLVPDLGVDKIYIYRYDGATRSLIDADPPTVSVAPGSGPRHLSFHPNGKFAYLINEMGGTVMAFEWDAVLGRLLPLQTASTLPPDYRGPNTSAEVHIHPNGKFLYASNRGPDDLAIFALNPLMGTLKLSGYQSVMGKAPRDFQIDPTGKFLFAVNQDSDNLVIFRIDPDTGALSQVGQPLQVPRPICITFLPVKQ